MCQNDLLEATLTEVGEYGNSIFTLNTENDPPKKHLSKGSGKVGQFPALKAESCHKP